MKVIFAPHADDELIGCYEIIRTGDPCMVIFTTKVSRERHNETYKLCNYFQNIVVRYKELQNGFEVDSSFEEFYFPDPFNELHPEHKLLGLEGYRAWKETNLNVIFYSTNMNVSYLHELSDETKNSKEAALNSIYPSQSDLWKYEKKYVFFEGRVKYLR